MNLRMLLPRRLRWRAAHKWVVRAEAAELMYGITEDEALRPVFARNAMEHYLRALRWYPMEHARQMPPPGNIGAHVVDEQLWPEVMSDDMTIPCILCGTPIPQARRGREATEGRYCSRCDF